MANLKSKAFWITFGDIESRGLAFFTTIYLARVIGAEYYGLITLALSLLGYALWFTDLGLLNIGTRETAKEPLKRIFRVKEIFNLKLFLGLGTLLFSFAILSSSSLGGLEKDVIGRYLLAIIPFAIIMEWYYNGRQQFEKIAFAKFMQGAVYFLLVIIFIHVPADIKKVPVFYVLGITSTALVYGIFSIREKPFVLPSRGMQIYPDLLKSGVILGLGSFFLQTVQLLPPILIGTMLSLKDAGIFGASFKVVVLATMADRVFVNLLLPNLASSWSTNKALTIKRVNTILKFVAIGGIGLALLISLLSTELVQLLYGKEYLQGAPIVSILSIFIGATFINSLFSYGLIAIGRDKEYLQSSGLGGLISIFLIVVAAFFGNIKIVAMAVSASEIIITLIAFHWFRKYIPINSNSTIAIPFVTGFLLFLSSYIIHLNTIVEAFVLCVLYVAIMFFINVISVDDLKWLKDNVN